MNAGVALTAEQGFRTPQATGSNPVTSSITIDLDEAKARWPESRYLQVHGVMSSDGTASATLTPLVPVPSIVRENTTYLSMLEIKEDDE